MPELLDQVKDAQAEERDHALADYRDLLHRRHDPRPGDADALRRVMTVLNISARDVEADAYAVSRVATLSAQILSDDQLRDVNAARTQARETFAAELRQLLHDIVDGLEPDQLPYGVNNLLRMGVSHPKGTVPFHQRHTDIGARWVEAQNAHMSKVGLHDQNSRFAAETRAKHPRAFAD